MRGGRRVLQMESEIEKVLKEGEPKEFWISNEERKQLIDILVMIGTALDKGNLYFNKPGESNKKFSVFCVEIARRLANMPVEETH